MDPRLAQLFERQRAFSQRTWDAAQVPEMDRLNRSLLALTAEVGELVQAAAPGWKWWNFDRSDHFSQTEELADMVQPPPGGSRTVNPSLSAKCPSDCSHLEAETIDVFLLVILVATNLGLTMGDVLDRANERMTRLENENLA